MISHAAQIGFVARRSLTRTLRQPFLVVPPLAFPLILLAVNASGLDAATAIPGFPAESYLDFAIVVTFLQGALFGAITAGTAVAIDIQTGFLNRLALTPLRGTAIVIGQLAGATALALLCSLCYLAIGLLAGVSIVTGTLGAIAIIGYALLTAIAFAGVGAAMGARTGSAEAVQGLFPLMFVLFFLSSMNLPRDLIEVDWFRTVATWNPVSYLVEGLRALVIQGWDATALVRGLVIAAAITALSFWATTRALRSRMERT